MSTTRYVEQNALPALLEALRTAFGQEQRILVPVLQPAVKESVVFKPWQLGMAFTLKKATVPPKEAVLPPCETLVQYKRTKNPENPAELTLEVTEETHCQPTIVFGCRPCDARGFSILDRPYLQGPFADPYYQRRRESLTVITQTCNSTGNTCFCHWTGSGPTHPEGSDVLMTAVENGYWLEAVSPRGEKLLAALSLADGAPHADAAQKVRENVNATLEPAPDLSKTQARLAARFTDADFWRDQTARCLSCGGCTYFCPTCYCFNITDEGDGYGENPGRRLRTWDSCMASHFTREASGHNSRPNTQDRMRNRISHKFSTYPETWGTFSCNGCGRCISNCPVCLDIRAIVLAATSD